MIQLRFVAGRGFVSRAICATTWSPYSHVEVVVPPNTYTGFSPKGYDYSKGGYLGAHNDGGVDLRPFDYDTQMIREIFGTIHCDPEVTKKVYDFIFDQLGKGYDLSAILGFLVHTDITERDKWFCSELVVAAFIFALYPLLNISKVNRVYPGMLLVSPLIDYNNQFPLYRLANV